MSLDKLDYVLALAEERNLTRAARKAFISQPTLTNYINRLEEQLGVKLFDRSVTPIEITRVGALYIEQMKKIQLAETNLRNELRILGSMETVFHLGTGATRGNHWLPLLLPEFCRRHPEMGIQLHEQGEEFLEDGVRQGEIDLAIGVLDTGYPELCYEKLAEEPVLLAIPRSYACVRDLPLTEATPARPYAIPRLRSAACPSCCPTPATAPTAPPNCCSMRPGCVRDAFSAIPICPLPGSSVPWDWERSLSPGRSLNAPSPADRNASPSAPCSSRSIPALRWRLTVRKTPGLPSAGRPLP